MQRRRNCLGAALVIFASGGVAIRVTPGDDPKYQMQVEQAWHQVVESMLHAGRGSSQADDGEEEKEKKVQNGPVRMQVSKQQMDELEASLSKDCADQFSASLDGDGPQLHTFGGGGTAHTMHTGVQSKEVSNSNASCRALEGRLCATRANVIQQRTSEGRKIRTTTAVDGDGCLPRHCIGEEDLGHLARFMQTKAKETMPGMGVEVRLNVNCEASGGSSAAVGLDHKAEYEKSKAEAERYVGKKEDPHSAAEKPEVQAHRSGALGCGASIGAAVVLTIASWSLL